MTTYRAEILKAASEAQRVLKKFPLGNRTSFDIVEAVTASGIELMFRPLGGLWGATINVDDVKGVLVTTKVGLPIQRFTLAHELGHIVLGHGLSLDKDVDFNGRFGATSLPIHELAANTFASELLASRNIMALSATRHGWNKEALGDPLNIYQLSLRLGISYKAACWGLASNKILPVETAQTLQHVVVKDIKARLAAYQYLQKNAWADVWLLTENDSGTFLEAGPDDIFVLHLKQDASAGFLWELIDAGPDSEILGDETEATDDLFGAYASKTILLRFSSPGIHRLIFEHHRPWSGQKIGFIDVSVTNFGKEEAGLPRRMREAALRKEAA